VTSIFVDRGNTFTYMNTPSAYPMFTGGRVESVVRFKREDIVSNINIGMEVPIRRIIQRIIHTLTIHIRTTVMLIEAYRMGGVAGVSRFVRGFVSSLLREVYSCYGLVFDGEISFFKLADAGVIGEDTAVLLTATYMALDSLLEDLEEAEDLGGENDVQKVLREIAEKLQELAGILTGLKPSSGIATIGIMEYRAEQLYQPSNYIVVHI